MPFITVPYRFTARAHAQVRQQPHVLFDRSAMLLRYLPYPGDVVPNKPEIAAVLRNTREMDPALWDIVKVGVDGQGVLFKLTFRGRLLTKAMKEEPNAPGPSRTLYEAFLEQATIVLMLRMGQLPDEEHCPGGEHFARLELELHYEEHVQDDDDPAD